LPYLVEAVLNHVSGHKAGVAGVYNRAKYEAEVRQALQRWADYLDELREAGKVIPLRRESR
jgi:acyl-CoA synthetase (NDP forming)